LNENSSMSKLENESETPLVSGSFDNFIS